MLWATPRPALGWTDWCLGYLLWNHKQVSPAANIWVGWKLSLSQGWAGQVLPILSPCRERVFLSDHRVPVFPHTLMCGQALLASVLQVEIAWRCLCVSLSFGPTGLGRCDQELHGRREKPALNFTKKPGFAFWKMHCNYCKSKKRRQKTWSCVMYATLLTERSAGFMHISKMHKKLMSLTNWFVVVEFY